VISSQAITWHLDGEHGISSEAIYDRLTYGVTTSYWGSNYPHDPSDFRRCEVLLRRVPDFRSRFNEMANEGQVWAALVERWQEIAALLERECPGVFDESNRRPGRMAMATYDLMRSIIDRAEGRAE
jgi:hypothetical protein